MKVEMTKFDMFMKGELVTMDVIHLCLADGTKVVIYDDGDVYKNGRRMR